MGKETKIGLVTGLVVIVIIGVLLSDYLGRPMAATNRPLDISLQQGEGYRNEVTKTVGVAVVGDNGLSSGNGVTGQTGGGSTPTGTDLPMALAIGPGGTGGTGPVVGQPVKAVPAGDIPVTNMDKTGPVGLDLATSVGRDRLVFEPLDPNKTVMMGPVVTLSDRSSTKPSEAKKVVGEEYTIAKGDTLTVIAKKFYKTARAEDRARIIAANPTMLKDEKSMLTVGKKLIIPPMPKPVVVAMETPKKAETVATDKKTGKPVTKIGLPGAGDEKVKAEEKMKAEAAKKAEEAKKAQYVVAKGDTIEKIARKVLGSGTPANVKKIMELNKMKNANVQVGMVLKMPVAG